MNSTLTDIGVVGRYTRAVATTHRLSAELDLRRRGIDCGFFWTGYFGLASFVANCPLYDVVTFVKERRLQFAIV
jgi:hypothetical protein